MTAKIRPDIAEAMYSRYHAARANEEPRLHIGASDLSQDCPRRIWYTWRHAGGERFAGKMLRLFERGHREEPELVEDLSAIDGIDVEPFAPDGKQWAYSIFGGHHRVNLDGIAHVARSIDRGDADFMIRDKRILEFKTMNLRRWEETHDLGVRFAMPGYHRQMQAQLAVTRLAGVEFVGCLFVAVCKNDDRLHVEEVDPDPKLMGYLVRLVKSMIEGEIPDRLDKRSSTCRWCHFKKICHDRRWEKVETNCRTCTHAAPVIDSKTPCEWACNAGERFGAVCEKHAVSPDF